MTTTDKPQLLAAGFIPDDARERLQQRFDILDYYKAENPEAILEQSADQICCMVGTSHASIPAELIKVLPKLRQVSIYGAGYEKIDIAALKNREITLTNTPSVMCEDVADLGMSMILATVRRMIAADRFVRDGRCASESMPFSHSVRGMTLGIAGLGQIGLGIARRAEVFGMKIIYRNRKPRMEVSYPYYDSIKALASASNVLLLAAPGGQETYQMVNADVLKALGPQGTLINIGRGSLVDEPALIHALQQGTIAAAGLDVFADLSHPPPELFAMENVVLSPHRGSATVESRAAMRDLFVANVMAFFDDTKPLTPVI